MAFNVYSTIIDAYYVPTVVGLKKNGKRIEGNIPGFRELTSSEK